jgi:indolepyruvate ferredoxin oxidoreductase alpha subunit
MIPEKQAETVWMSGNEAIALGAYEAGVKVASGYPGTPSTEIMEHLSEYDGLYTEWAPNEKVGLEVAIGASFGGVRALATMKHVGLNVAADPLFTAAYTGGRGGLVVLTADDPDMHSSQNEQDSRNYAFAAKLPMLEPADPAEAKEFIKEAFELSEELDCPVLVRITTRIAHVKAVVTPGERLQPMVVPGLEKHPEKFVMLPAMARRRRLYVEERMTRCRQIAEDSGNNVIESGDAKRGFITGGVSYLYVKEAFPEASILKLGMAWPLPEQKIREFAGSVDELYVVEELDPFWEIHVKAMGISCHGKDVIPAIGELNTGVVKQSIDPARLRGESFSPEELPPRPPNMCPGCPHRGVFFTLSRLDVFISGDIGCYTLGFLPPLNALDSTVCMGASVPIAHGLEKALGADSNRKIVAVIGDSTFVHSGITGLINSVYNGSRGTLIILDNGTTAMTGQQPNPASGALISGEPAQSIDLEALCKALGVRHVTVINPHEVPESRKIIRAEVERDELSVIISQAPCVLLPELKYQKPITYFTNIDNCVGCSSCIRIGCPAISWTPFAKGEAEARGYKKSQKGYSQIDEVLCNDCGQCASLCKFGAITPRDISS